MHSSLHPPTTEMLAFSSTRVWWLTLAVVLVCGIAVKALLPLFRKERLPQVEFLRLSEGPGKAGGARDVQAFLDDSLGAIMKGYTEYSKRGRHFLLRTPKQVYFVAASRFLDEIRKAPDTQLSQPAAANIIFQTKHTLHPALVNDFYHFDVVRKGLGQGLPRILPDLADEAHLSIGLELGPRATWSALPVFPIMTNIITRISNRMMVGLPLCRNDEFLHYSGIYTKATFDSATLIRNLPEFLKGPAMFFRTDHKKELQTARKYLIPIIKERLAAQAAGDLKEKRPDDALQWLLDITPPEKADPEILLQRMIHINVTAIHAPAVTITECIFDLCHHPEIHEDLREEIADVLGKSPPGEVWTKSNMERLVRMDSFMRESARLTPMSAMKMERLAVSDVTLSDGTMIPRGTSVGVISHGRHLDEDLLENARTFDAFRYVRLREQPGMETQFSFAQASSENMMFGLGRHACPGRHFASVLIKLILVQVLVFYDIKFLDGVPRPQSKWTQKFRNPDFSATVGFLTRAAEDRFSSLYEE